MKYTSILFFSLIFFPAFLFGQTYNLEGTLTDDVGDPLFGAIARSGNIGVSTDFDGRYLLKLPAGKHTIIFSYVGYESKEMEVNMTANQTLNVKLGGTTLLQGVTVTADIAKERETPVAFSNIPTIKLAEELAGQDLPMILNSTPGAYATGSGGGDGDARITIRGFNQRNVAVMLDGVPVNDMENGWVYWSNWFGLDNVTKTMQVQRGLGASKLSIPSVGGTINIITKGIESRKGLKFTQEVGNNGYLRSTIGLTSGRMENGWAVSAAGSYKQGDGWVDGTYTKGYFYYLRVDKEIGNHLVSLSGFGAPQEHGQRPFTTEIAQVDAGFAKEVGVPSEVISQYNTVDKGRRYNEHWGYLDGEVYNTRKNYYHKPQISLKHSWKANKRVFLNNVAYLSIGNGGGTAPEGVSFPRTEDGQIDMDLAVQRNQEPQFGIDVGSQYFLRSGINNHYWTGLLSTLKFDINENLTLSSGIDGRYYQGGHYREVYDLLEGSYYRFGNDSLQVGDKLDYHYNGYVRWAGIFGLAEYKKDKWSVFLNLSGALTSYSADDFMKPHWFEIGDTTFTLQEGESLSYNGQTYTTESPEANDPGVTWQNLPNVTFKTGASYKIDKVHSVFVNLGYLNKAQRFTNVINTNRFGDKMAVFANIENEEIAALEFGYGLGTEIFSANVNLYYTNWNNKPLDSAPSAPCPGEDPNDADADRCPINVSGINALHQGIEIDFAFKPLKSLSLEGLISVGDWRWTSKGEATIEGQDPFVFDAVGVHVGDAAQFQLGGLIRYEPIKGLYFKVNGTFFDQNYASFQPEDLKPDSFDEGQERESWKLPSYAVFNAHAGYSFTFENKTRVGLRFNILNFTDAVFITDARNNDTFNSQPFSDFDAKSASVHFGQGRRWNTSVYFNF